jgi:hypothetical protein
MIPCKGLGRETPLCVACQLPGKFLYRSRCKLEPVPSCFHHPFGGSFQVLTTNCNRFLVANKPLPFRQ